MKIVTVLGARPQFIKASMVSFVLRKREDERFNEVIVHTGQHFDSNMSAIFFEEMRIPEPDYYLGIASLSHGAMTGRMLEAVENVLEKERPDLVLVYGDTNSTLAGALAAAKLNISIGHVEAGLRSFNRRMPEEINRVVADHVSDFLFAPTEAAVRNLTAEGLAGRAIHRVGDVMYDAALYFAKLAHKNSHVLEKLRLSPKNYALVTVHRAENTDDESRLREIVERLSEVAAQLPVVFPVHPRTRGQLEKIEQWKKLAATVCVVDPLGYLDMVVLEKNARMIITDSGGVQKEACFHRVPCVTLRAETEWVELVEMGWNRLAPPFQPRKFSEAMEWALRFDRKTMREDNLYGDGHAAELIAVALADRYAR